MALGRTSAISAKSTDVKTPKPMPRTAAATIAPGQVCHPERTTIATAMRTPDQITDGFGRPTRSDHTPPEPRPWRGG